MAEPRLRDRVGIGWRPELAAGLYLALDRLDVVEVIADNFLRAGQQQWHMLRALARQVPLLLHGVGLGLASSHAVERARVDRLARLIGFVAPESWSEHLAFVRAGGHEIGHLAAPPRSDATLDGALRNIALAARIVGAPPQLENVATLIDPPASTLDEPTWIARIAQGADVSLLLDLHNLYANARNFGRDPFALLAALPLQRVRTVHLSGGVEIEAPSGARRLLDDHLHDPPDIVYALLAELAARVAQPLTVIVERDGAYPPVELLLAQVERAREVLAAGRAHAGLRQAA